MILSFALQTITITAVIIASIFTVDTLGAFSLPQPLPPLPRIFKAVQLVKAAPHASAAHGGVRLPARPFLAPSRIPTSIPVVSDPAEAMLAQVPSISAGGFADGVPGAFGSPVGVPQALPEIAAPATAPAPVQKQEPAGKALRIGGDVMEAKLVKRVLPVYPRLARQARISGRVRLEGVISREGHITNLQVVQGHPLLAPAALEAVRQWVYRPTLLNGRPVEVIAPIDVHFTLSQ